MILRTRQLLGAYDRAEMMLQAGLYTPGADQVTDGAVKVWSDLDAFIGSDAAVDIGQTFNELRKILSAADVPIGKLPAGNSGVK